MTMASMRITVVLALFCGMASAACGPSDLVVDIGDNKGDLVDLKVQWKAGVCPIAQYRVFVQSPTTGKTEVGRTTDTQFTIEDQEFWTHYTITLETAGCLVNGSLTAEIVTGPGNPHKVESIETETSATAANVTFLEAHMPRIVDLYNVTYCSPLTCERRIIARNTPAHLGNPTSIRTSLKPLTPNTVYNISVVPEIAYEEKRFAGEPVASVFATRKN